MKTLLLLFWLALSLAAEAEVNTAAHTSAPIRTVDITLLRPDGLPATGVTVHLYGLDRDG